MKKLTILFAVLLLHNINIAAAQEAPKIKRFTLNEHTVVKDSTGKIIPMLAWQKMMRSGNYVLSPEDATNEKTVFFIRRPKQHQSIVASSQQSSVAMQQADARPVKNIILDENSIVRDSSGIVYPYVIWRKLAAAGEYYVQPVNVGPDSVSLILKKRTEQQLDAMMAKWKKPDESENFKIGSEFKPFKDKDINGEKIDLKQWAGKVVVLNFWFIGCPPCRDEIPDLNQLAERYKDNKDVIFVAVALDPSDDIKEYIKLHPFNYHIIDRGQYIASKYGVRLYPTNVIINRDGKVAYSAVSSQPANRYWFKKTINEALAAPVSTTAAK